MVIELGKSKYSKILEFIKKYSGHQYKMLSKCKQGEELKYMQQGSEAGKTARAYFTEIIDSVADENGLSKGRITQWQNSGTFVSYFWCQLKKQKFVDSNISISIFAEKATDEDIRFRVSVELAVENATEEEKLAYGRLLDKSLESKLVYISGGNNEKEFQVLEERNPQKVKSLNLKKVQVSYIPDNNNLQSDEVFIDSIKEGTSLLLTYYDFILGESTEVWWPSLSEYNPGMTKNQWLELLEDRSIFTDNAYFAIAAMYNFGGTVTCRQLEEKYGRTSDFYRASLGVQLASKIKNKLALSYCVSEKDGNEVWPILFQGRFASSDEPGNYVWRIRPELYEALKEFGIERYLKEGEKEVPKLSIKESMELIKEYIASKGFSYDGELIENFYLSLKSKPFVILAGTSGTGKTRLVRLFAEAIGANYKLVSVRPDWSDSSDLFGHANLKGEFVPGAIIDYIHEAAKPENINIPYFLCMDEMNLARVEYYLSDFLSIIETRHREDGRVVTDEIILDKAASVTYGKVILPENLYVIGTVNMDETTFPFSKKVLDRANTIEFSYVDLVPDFSETLVEAEAQNYKNDFLKTDYITLMSDTATEDRQFVSDICLELQEINEILQRAQAHVGYRVRDEIVFYMLNNKKAELLDTNLAFDNEIMQKILPRIQGSSASIKDMLCELFKKCAGDYTGLSQASVSEQMQVYVETKDCKYKKSAEKICYMMRGFEEDGFTSYWL